MNEYSPEQEPNDNQLKINSTEELSFGYQPNIQEAEDSPRTKVGILSAERNQLIGELQAKGHSEELRERLDDVNHALLGAQADLFEIEGTTGANQGEK